MFVTTKYYSVMANTPIRLVGKIKPTGKWIGTLRISRPESIDSIAPAGTEIHQNDSGCFLVYRDKTIKKVFIDSWDRSKVIQIRTPILKM